MTLARWTQPSGPLCLWQCFIWPRKKNDLGLSTVRKEASWTAKNVFFPASCVKFFTVCKVVFLRSNWEFLHLIFIRPESDHLQPLSLTHSLTDWPRPVFNSRLDWTSYFGISELNPRVRCAVGHMLLHALPLAMLFTKPVVVMRWDKY